MISGYLQEDKNIKLILYFTLLTILYFFSTPLFWTWTILGLLFLSGFDSEKRIEGIKKDKNGYPTPIYKEHIVWRDHGGYYER